MSNWKSALKADPTGWLLENNNPSVRYLALTDILDKRPSDLDVSEAKRDIMFKGVVPLILERQEAGGHWDVPSKFYTAKYTGTVWQLIILAELFADGQDERIKKAAEFLLENSQDRESGGFSQHTAVRSGGGQHSEVIPCLTANMIWSLIRFGYADDPRVRRGIDWITTYQRFDDGVADSPPGWPYDKYEICWGKHTCHMGVVKALKALAEIPNAERTTDVQRTIDDGAEYLLKHHIYKRSHELTKVSKPGWRRFGFPLMYQTDVLEILGILTKLGFRDERMQEALDLLLAKQDDLGRWNLDTTFNGRFQVDIDEKGRPSKWTTLNALRVLKRYA